MKEVYDKLRGMIRRVTVKSIKDDGQLQTASAEVADGIWREDIEVMAPYGLISVPDDDGAVGVAIAIGGDEGDMVLLPLANPSQRMGGLEKGDVGLANKGGDRVILRAGGGIEIKAATSVTITVGGCSVTHSAAGLDVDGGYIRNDGVVVDKTHVHGGVLLGGSETDPPAG